MTLDALIARAKAARAPAQFIRPPEFARMAARCLEPDDPQARALAGVAEKIRSTYMEGCEAGFAAGKSIAARVFLNCALAGATMALAAALFAFTFHGRP